MSTFFTSNTNFSDLNACIKYNRPFETIDAMDSSLISKWNSVVGVKDIVYILGNFGNYDILPNLNGKIILLEGETEHRDFDGVQYNDRVQYFANKYGITYLINTELDVGELTREELPVKKLILQQDASDISHGMTNNTCYIYADSKNKDIITKSGINVAIDIHNFKPVSLQTLLFYIKGALTTCIK